MYQKLMVIILLLIECQLIFAQMKCTSLESSIVATKSGKVKGICSYVNANDKIGEDRSANVYKYMSIPYAEAPIEEKRFKEPIPKKPWSDTLDATVMPKSCPQYIQTNLSSKIEFTNSLGLNKNADISEDCLLLNVYTTSLKEKRPVLVVLHGGSDKEMGSSVLSIHNPEVFVAMTGIVVVTVNYRVGIFGNLFFNNGTEFFPGNQGFLDQHLALKWINENAAKFGGDPNRITLLGYDSGALYATYHMVYKPSWPLFRNVIVQSLSPINLARSHLSPRTASNRAAAFVQHLNCSSLKCLYEMNAFNLTVQSRSFLHGFMSQKSILSASFLKSAFQPVVDGRVFNESVIKSFREGRFKKCFMILGFNANSGASSIPLNYGLSQDPLNGNTQNIDYPQFEQFIRKYYSFYPNWPMRNDEYFFESLLNEYTKNVSTMPSYFRALRKTLTDESFACSILKLLEYITRYSEKQQKVYFYIYEHRISTSKWPSSYGVVANDELASLFAHSFRDDVKSSDLLSPNPFLASGNLAYSKTDRLVSKEVIVKWCNFIYNDDPNKSIKKPFKLRDSPGKVWPEFRMNHQSDSNNMLYYSFKTSGTFSFKLYSNQTESCNLWNRLIPIHVETKMQFKSTTTSTAPPFLSSNTNNLEQASTTQVVSETSTLASTNSTTQSDLAFGLNDFSSDSF